MVKNEKDKKDFIKNFDNRYFTIEFHHGTRGTFFDNCGMELATETATKCSMQGGICFIFPEKYKETLWALINQFERENHHRIYLDFFKSNVPSYIREVDNQKEILKE